MSRIVTRHDRTGTRAKYHIRFLFAMATDFSEARYRQMDNFGKTRLNARRNTLLPFHFSAEARIPVKPLT